MGITDETGNGTGTKLAKYGSRNGSENKQLKRKKVELKKTFRSSLLHS